MIPRRVPGGLTFFVRSSRFDARVPISRSFCTPRIPKSHQKVILLSGITGSGKTQISLEVAKRIGGEVIIGDSMQFYKGVDVGTDKIHPDQMKGIPHHLIDTLDITETCTAGRFHKMAIEKIEDILARGKVPIVVGGTIFYLKWLLLGPQEGGPTDRALIKEIADQLEQDPDWKTSLLRLEKIDEEFARTIPTNDYRRLLRSLVKIKQTNRPISELDQQRSKTVEDYSYDFRSFYLVRPRLESKLAVARRVEQFFQRGLIQEVHRLIAERGLTKDHQCSHAIGYREIMDLLTSDERVNEATIKETIRLIQTRTNQLITKQIKFARNPSLLDHWRWIDVSQHTKDQENYNPSQTLEATALHSVSDDIVDFYNLPVEEAYSDETKAKFAPPSCVFEVPKDIKTFVPSVTVFRDTRKMQNLIAQTKTARAALQALDKQ